MEILAVINKVLDIKLVQWALLISVLALSGVAVWKELTIGKLKLEKAYFETEYSKVASGLAIQNEAVQRLAEETNKQREYIEQAAKKADKVALENAKTLQGIMNTKLIGTCDEKVAQTYKLIREGK